MTRRAELLTGCPEEFLPRLIEIIDEMETEVNRAKDSIEEMKGVEDLHMIQEALNQLDKLSTALF